MIKQTLKKTMCCKCGHVQEILINENENFDNNDSKLLVTFSDYSVFKNPILNCCENCGYINDDIHENNNLNNFYDKERLKQKQFDPEEMFQTYAKNGDLTLTTLRVWAHIFNKLKTDFYALFADYYRKPAFDKILETAKSESNLVVQRICLLIEACLIVFPTSYISCFYVEALAFLGQSQKARQQMLNLNLDDKLREYLLECIEMGEPA